MACLRGVMIKAMDCRIAESVFELQSRYYIHFRKNTFGQGMNPFIPSLQFFLKYVSGIK